MSSTDEPVDVEDIEDTIPEEMLWDSDEDSEEGSAIDDVPLEYRLEHWQALHDPPEIAQHVHFVIEELGHPYWQVRSEALHN